MLLVKKMRTGKKIIIAIVILLLIIYFLIIEMKILKERENSNILKAPYEISEAEELLKYYNCTNIDIRNSKEDGYKKDIYLVFGEDLWKDADKSNEGYFGEIVANLSGTLDYESYRLIDSSRNIVIAVITNKEKQKNVAIYINGKANYFQSEQTKKVAEKEYEKIPVTSFNVTSIEIQTLIQNKWKIKDVNLGTIESRFDDYDIYFDEGIKVKSFGGKVFNIVFTEKYKGSIINNFKVNTDFNEIASELGKPTFNINSVIGYKGEKIYVFFSKNEVSVYRIEDDYQETEFLKIANDFYENKNIKEFINKIKKLWQDYDDYIYDSNWAILKYTLKGLTIEFNTNGENGIKLYNNFNSKIKDNVTLETISTSNLPEFVYLHTDEDLVYNQELNRISNESLLYDEEFIAMQNSPTGKYSDITNSEDWPNYRFNKTESEEFNLIYSYTEDEGIYGIKFVSKTGEYPNSELTRHKQIYTYGWYNNNVFIYSVKNIGIYAYNAKTGELETVLEGNNEFKIKEIREDVIYYDDAKIELK